MNNNPFVIEPLNRDHNDTNKVSEGKCGEGTCGGRKTA